MKQAWITLLLIPALAFSAAEAGPDLTRLPNGFSIVHDRIENTGIVSFGIWVGVGSVHEKDEEAGIAHMLEHMLFKGSRSYPPGEAERKIETFGGRMNGATSFEYTCYYITVPSAHFEEAFGILADMLKNPMFCPDEYERELGVVLREIDQREDNPRQRSARLFYQVLYPHHYYARPIIGYRETVASMELEDVKKFYRGNYFPGSMVLIAAGDIDRRKVARAAKEEFGKLPPGEPAPAVQPRPETYEKVPATERADITGAYFWTGMPGPEISSGDIREIASLSTAMKILGDGRTSRLYRRLRDELNLVSSVSAGFSFLPRGGPLYVRAEFSPGDKEAVKKSILEEIERLKKDGISQKELQRARIRTRSDMLFDFEGSADRIRIYGNYAVSGNLDFLEKFPEAVEGLSKEDIEEAAREYLLTDRFLSAALLPREDDN